MYSNIFAALICLLELTGLVSAIEHIEHRVEKRQSAYPYNGPKVPQYNFSMPVDHFNKSDTRTYNNRYFVNDTYWKPGGPVFFYTPGEAGASEGLAAATLGEVNRSTAVMQLSKKYNGVAVMWEHRYYGLSYPIPLNKTTNEPQGGISGYKYLSIEQALQDFVYFAKRFKPVSCSGNDCKAYSPSKAPWVWIGGSYPGDLGAFARIRNPEIFHAVWASSAPVEAMLDGSGYFNPILTSLPANCSSDIRAVVKFVDETFSGDHGAQALTELRRLAIAATSTTFQINSTYNLTDTALYTPYYIGQQMTAPFTLEFQYDGPSLTSDIFCNYLQSYNPSGTPSNTTNPYISILTNPGNGQIKSMGITATYNISTAVNAYFYAYRRWMNYLYYTLILSQRNHAIQPPPTSLGDASSWRYQVVTELGWAQASNPNNITILSKYYNYTTLYDNLKSNFQSSAGLPNKPNVTTYNKYGGWNMKPSNVMFTNGQFDPWRSGGVMSYELNTDAPRRNVTQTVPQCNKPPNGTDVFGLLYSGAVHVSDLAAWYDEPYTPETPLAQGLALFSQALDKWLPCFKPS